MGKFSKPRNNPPVTEETVVLPKAPTAEPMVPQNAENIPPIQEEFEPLEGSVQASRKKAGKIMLISVCSVAAVMLIGIAVALFLLFGRDPNDHRILNNVYIAGVNLGGMTKSEAEAALHAVTDDTYAVTDMVIELPDIIMNLTPADTKVNLDVDAAVDAAYDYGRKGTREEREAALQNSMVMDHPIALLPYLNLDLEYIRGQLDSYGNSFNSVYAPSGAEMVGTMPILDAAEEGFNPEVKGQTLVVSLGNPGRYVDIDEVYNRVLDAYSFNTFLVQVSMKEEEKIPEELDLEALYEQFYIEPVDATIDKQSYEVVSEVYGYGFDLEAATEQLAQASYGETLEIPMALIEPALLGDSIREMLFRDVLCEYKTEHTNNANRNNNLTLACAAINGTVLYPGEEFDYNTVVGKRTADKGYKTAAAYSSGKTVQTLGGGVCQVSSTIYYCCLVADLEIVNRLPHSYVSSYMPMGMDATVSWGGPEFTFKNNTNYPLRIETWVADGFVHCKLVGTDEKDYYIVMEYEVIGSQSPDTVYEEYPEGNSEGYKDGEVIQTAYRGYSVNTYKCKYSKETDELISRDFDKLSVYKKRDKIIAKIVRETEPPTEAPAPADPPAEQPPATEAPAPADPPADPPAEGSE